MSDASSRPPAPTRQQLDELEALMQQMLALPVKLPDDEGAAQVPVPEAVSPAESRRTESPAAQFTVRPPADWPPVRQDPEIAPAPTVPLQVVVADRPPVLKLKRPIVPRRRTGDGMLAPLIWTNRVFDLGTRYLGQPGRWLRSSAGRSVLGWVGFLLLAAALAWMFFERGGWSR